MLSRKKCLIFGLSLVFTAGFGVNTFAAEEMSVTKKESIVEHCDAIRDSLEATQHTDSYARTYLGALYDAILNRFIMPLNVRLLKNNAAIEELTKIQADFVAERAEFNADFVLYSKELENLINIDCKDEPEEFYAQLEKTRVKRAVVDEDTKKLEKLVFEQKQIVAALREGL